jgi:large subunit ribosomal protein L13
MATKIYQTRDADRTWYVIDAKGIILGRLAVVAADLLRGKNKPTYSPNVDGGDNVIVLNASKIKLSTDAKYEDKKYYRHSGYLGGMREESFNEAIEKHPERVIMLAVKGMLQNNKLGSAQLKRLRVYPGTEHAHTQELMNVDMKEIK